jgi:polyhydroxyalkanoate synthase
MKNPPSAPEDALQDVINAAHSQVSQFIGTLPLNDADIQEFTDVLARSPHLRKKLAELQRHYLQTWVEIVNDHHNPPGNDSGDRRFIAPEWHEIPWFNTIRKLYLLNTGYLEEVTGLLDPKPSNKSRLAFFCKQLADAMSPANNPATNPQALKQAFQSGGQSFVQGAQLFAADAVRGRISMTDETAFEVGRNIAITPGDVIFENELVQLIQYRATTARVHSRPLLIVPPFINKYYVLDLQESNSFVRYCVEHGMTTFIISWRNIPEELGHLTWDDYLDKGIFAAIEAVRSISGSESINTLGFCVGGTLLAAALAVNAARKEKQVNSLTLLASMLDFSDTGEISVYVDESYVAQTESKYGHSGVLPGSQLSSAFSSLRANELVWHFVVNNYLLGKTPRAFDLLHWNSDSSNLPGPLYAYYLRNMYLENRLRVPDALRMKGESIDLGAIDVPAMVVATREDHIVPWKTAYRSATLLGGNTQFVLGASGHVAGIVNPASANRRQYWISDESDLPADPAHWQDTAHEIAGSWWNQWMTWLRPLAGKRVRARKTTGNKNYIPLEPAPGRYVRENHEFNVRLNPNTHSK